MFDIREIASIVAGRLVNPRAVEQRPQRIRHDSRLIENGDLFVALPGARVDGHRFALAAFQRGACAALIAEDTETPPEIPNQIVVPNTLAALQALARAWRSFCSARRAAITGSNGKTTTRALLEHLLGGAPAAFGAPQNYNTEIGLPLALLAMPAEAQIGVFELGAGEPGDIAQLAEILRPDVGIITSVGPSHLDRFGSIEAVAREKWTLAEALPAGGLLLMNADCDSLRQRLASSPPACRVVRVGIEQGEIRGRVQLEAPRLELTVDEPAMRLACPLLGRHNAGNLLLAAAAAAELGVPVASIEERAASFTPIPHRLQPIAASFGTILDDTYNANPASAEAALRVLAACGPPGTRRVFVFGDMLDLAEIAETAHERIAELALQLSIDTILPVGEHATRACRAVGASAFLYVDRADLVDALSHAAGAKAIVLVKGSRALGLEGLVNELLQGDV